MRNHITKKQALQWAQKPSFPGIPEIVTVHSPAQLITDI
jgi:hypothetical protein